MIVLSLNSGSSSLKFGLYRVTATEVETLLASQLGSAAELPECIARVHLPAPEAFGHRVVHGGPELREHTVIDDAVLARISAAAQFAPLHAPACLELIARSRELFPALPQVACFDTAFHATLPDTAHVLPIPRVFRSHGIRRYGFHGLSCESIVQRLQGEPQGVPERLLIAHLGNGASVTAVKAGRSVDTSMGLTPDGGLVMGTRPGDIDPGVLMHLLRQVGGDADRLDDLLGRQSGLLGISGLASDMRRLHDAAPTEADARLAIRIFCVSAAKQLAAMMTVLGGADLIVFSGGIGENYRAVRAAICESLRWFGIALDTERNALGQGVISAQTSRCTVRVLASQEEMQIASHTAQLLGRSSPSL